MNPDAIQTAMEKLLNDASSATEAHRPAAELCLSCRQSHNVTLPEILRSEGHKLKRLGSHWVCLCPYHREKTPSCSVWDDHLHCFGCSAHKSVQQYLAEAGKSVPATTWRPITRPKPAPPFNAAALLRSYRAQTTPRHVSDLAKALGVSESSLVSLDLMWSGESWVFPMRSGSGQVVGFRVRTLSGRKLAVTGSRSALFVPSVPPQPQLWICEGPTDTAAALDLGLYAIGRPNCNSCVSEVIQFLSLSRQKVREVVIVLDNDEPGQAGARALQSALTVPNAVLTPPAKDLRSYLLAGGTSDTLLDMLRHIVRVVPKT